MKTIEEMHNLGVFSEAWFEAAFDGVEVSKEIKQAARHICMSYDIKGQSDPGYIANVIRMYLEEKKGA